MTLIRGFDIRRRRLAVLGILALVLVACGDDDDTTSSDVVVTTTAPTPPSTLPPASTSDDTVETTGSSTATSEPAGGCTANADRVGEVDGVAIEELIVDGVRAGAGDTVCDGSAVTTNESGTADILGRDDDQYCRLRRSTSITVLAGPVVVYYPTDGADLEEQLRCPNIDILGPDDVVLGAAITSSLTLGSYQGAMTVSNVGEEVVSIDVPGSSCRAVVEPGYRLTLPPADVPAVTAFDPNALAPEFAETLPGGGMAEFEPGPLVPGLAAAIDDGDATLTVDGEVPADPTDEDVSLVAGRLVDLPFTLDPTLNAPVFQSPVTIDGGSTATTSPPTTAPADEPTTVDVPVFVDDDGGLWAAQLFVGSDTLDDLQSALRDAVLSGSYGRTYRLETGRTPPYAEVFPELLGEFEQC